PDPYGGAFACAPDGRGLALAVSDGAVLVWDLSAAWRDAPAASPLGADELEPLWADLAGTDAAKAYAALNRLAARPAESVPLLRDRLRAAARVPAERLQRWIADLNDDDIEVRNAATGQLAALGSQAVPR